MCVPVTKRPVGLYVDTIVSFIVPGNEREEYPDFDWLT